MADVEQWWVWVRGDVVLDPCFERSPTAPAPSRISATSAFDARAEYARRFGCEAMNLSVGKSAPVGLDAEREVTFMIAGKALELVVDPSRLPQHVCAWLRIGPRVQAKTVHVDATTANGHSRLNGRPSTKT